MIQVTVNIFCSPVQPSGLEFEYTNIHGDLEDVVAAAKILHPDWSSISVIETRPTKRKLEDED
jgi:hypothetical protein